MKIKDKLSKCLGSLIDENWDALAEIRIRAEKPLRLRMLDGRELTVEMIGAEALEHIVHILMENSVYAREEELKEGYFTASDGCRVGICGKLTVRDGRIVSAGSIGSVCIRIPREIKGCADPIMDLEKENLLILSPPGMGKTTLIRDFARQISEIGRNVAIADERRELAACVEGVPCLDVGSRTDVMDGCPKTLAIPMLIRACAPDWIIADEIGCMGDANALLDAARCGIRIAASAHARNLEDAVKRRAIGSLLREKLFANIVVLGKTPGKILKIHKINRGVNA